MNELVIDLPNLNSIKLGYRIFEGNRYNDACSLKMESNIDMNELINRSS